MAINPERVDGNGGVVGYKATLEADSNMFWQDAIVKTYTVNNSTEDASSNITLLVDTDLDEFIYPKVTIHIGSVGGDIIIFNNDDDSSRMTKFVGMSPMSSVIMKGEINYINDQYYLKFANRNFIRLVDGENTLTIKGNVQTIEFEYSARRFM